MDVINRGMKGLLVLGPPEKVPPVPLFVLLPREIVTAAPLIESFYGNFPARGPPFPSVLSLTCAFSNFRLVHKIPNSLKFKTPSGGDASLQKIRTWKNSKVPFSCPVCPEKFRIKSKLVRHIRLHHGSGIKCRLCLRTFSSVSACTTHLTMKHSKQGYPCSGCDFKTFQASEFESHWQEHRGHVPEAQDAGKSEEKGRTKNSEEDKKKFFCDLCPTEYTRKSQLLRHKNEMHGVDIACEICSQVFNSMVSLRSHVFTKHTGKDNICEICGYSTKKMYDFKRHQVKHNNEYTVTCTVCNKGFYSAYEFNEHKNVHTAERPYQCEVCGVDYSRRSSLILHKNRKHPEIYDSSKRCPVCNRVCITKDTMEAHVKTHFEGRKRYYCDICGKGLLTAMILKIHRRSHTGEKPFDCSHCGRAFSCKKNLAVHIRLHTGERPYSCKVCWKAYTKSSALKTHEKTHSGRYVIESKIEIKEEPLYQDSDEEEQNRNCPTGAQVKEENLHCQQKAPCDFCGELYLRNQLARHKKRHYEESKNHKCEHCRLSFTMMTKLAVHRKTAHGLEMICEKCDKQFQNVYSFSSHLRKHKKERSFVCDVCGFATTEKGTLCSHKLVKHQIGKFPFHCSTCGKGFLSNYLLSDHINRHTGATPHQCHKCGSAYSSIRSLERHCYKFHPELYKDKFFKCKTCTRVYKSLKNLEAHQAEKHPNGRRNFCDICGKDFSFRESLIRHRRIHTGEKPKECSVCKRRFACATYLQSHMRTHTGEKPYQCRFCWKKFSQRSSMVTHEKTHLKGLKSSGLEIAPLASEPQNAP